MSFFVPRCLQENLPTLGAEGAGWLDGLPAQIAQIQQAWSLQVGGALDSNANCSWIAPVRLEDGSEAILKIGFPHSEARHEAEALRVYDGRGAVRLLRVSEDGFTLLLERCLPGTDLWSLTEEESDAMGAGVLQRLWRDMASPTPFQSLSELVDEWCEELPRTAPAAGYDAALIAASIERGRDLTATQPRSVLLHGDFHPSNVLSAAREPWLVIDPKPVVGDPAYDLAQWLGNRLEAAEQSPDPVSHLRLQIDRFSERLGLDPARIAGWAFVKSLGWDWGPVAARLLHQVSGAYSG
jgi:streptomycin 6-kinase